MKSSEFHRKIQQSKKWWYVCAEGSHYIYENEKGERYPVPYHGSKEMNEPLRKRIAKAMDIQ